MLFDVCVRMHINYSTADGCIKQYSLSKIKSKHTRVWTITNRRNKNNIQIFIFIYIIQYGYTAAVLHSRL